MELNKSIIFCIAIMLLLSVASGALALERADTSVTHHTDSMMINFQTSKWDLDLSIGDNAASLERIDKRLSTVLNDSIYRLRHIRVYGGASPEGSVAFNKFLSEHRAQTLFDWFDKYNQLSDMNKTFIFFGRDWEGVFQLAENDLNIPYRDETLALLGTIVDEKRQAQGQEPAKSLERVKNLRGGVPYSYLYQHIFPAVRASRIIIDYERVLAPEGMRQKKTPTVVRHDTVYVERVVEVRDTIYVDTCKK